MTTYEITIKRKSTIRVKEETGWIVVDKRPWTSQEFDEAAERLYGTQRDNFLTNTLLKEVRGYAPAREVDKVVDTEVFKQTIEVGDSESDMVVTSVVKALNK